MALHSVTAVDWRAALDRFPQETIETDGGDISVRRSGNGPTVLLLHGIGSGSGSWAYQLEALAAAYSVIAWDAPGYGDSAPVGRDPPTADDYAGRLAQLVEALGLDRFVLVGHSLGALIAGHYASQHPDRLRGLVLGNPAAGHGRLPAEERAAKLDSRLKPFAELGAEEYANQKAVNLLASDPSEDRLELVRWNMTRLTSDGLGAAARLLAGGDLVTDVGHYDGPAIVLCGDEDRITPPDACRVVADAFPGGRPFHLIERAGHASYIDAPDVFTRHITDFEKTLGA